MRHIGGETRSWIDKCYIKTIFIKCCQKTKAPQMKTYLHMCTYQVWLKRGTVLHCTIKTPYKHKKRTLPRQSEILFCATTSLKAKKVILYNYENTRTRCKSKFFDRLQGSYYVNFRNNEHWTCIWITKNNLQLWDNQSWRDLQANNKDNTKI